MADEIEKVKIIFDTNAKQAIGDVNNLGVSIENATSSTNENNESVKAGSQDYKSFKSQLREANAELQKQIQLTGETSEETRKAAKAVANLKDQMGFAKDISDSFNPDQKFKALGAATQLAGTGLQGVTSGMALFGGESEDTEKMLLKVQAAMSFSDAISNLSNLGDQWDIFKSVVSNSYTRIIAARQADIAVTVEQTIAQRILNATMLLNPYIAIGAAIAAVSIATYAWIKASNEEAAALKIVTDAVSFNKIETENLSTAIEETSKATEGYNTLEVARAKALGASDKEIQKIIQSQKDLAVATTLAFSSEAWQNVLKAQGILRQAFKTGNEDVIKDASESLKDAQDIYKQANDAFNSAIIAEGENRLNVQADILQKAREAAAKLAEERRKAAEEERKRLNDEAKEAGRLAEARYQKEYDDFVNFRLLLVEAKVQADSDEHDRVTENLNRITEEENARLLKDAEEKKKIDEYKLEQKKVIEEKQFQVAEGAVGLLTALAGKSKGLQRASIIAESAVGIGRTVQGIFTGNAAALAQGIVQAGPILGPGLAAPAITLNSIQGGLSVAGNIAATAKALQAVGGGSAPSAGNVGGGSAGSVSAPSVQFNNSSENQIAQATAKAQASAPPVKVNVLESDITLAQDNVKVLESNNSF